MKLAKIKCYAAVLGIFLWLVSPASTKPLFASGHGCATNEPDRDGDGVADKDDAFPDDPSRYKQEPAEENREGVCGTEPVKLKLYFIPFSADIAHPVTAASIEKDRVHALWFCSKNDAMETIQNILDQNEGGASAAKKSSAKETRLSLGGPKASYGLVSDETETPQQSESDENNQPNAEGGKAEDSPSRDLDAAVEKLKSTIMKASQGAQASDDLNADKTAEGDDAAAPDKGLPAVKKNTETPELESSKRNSAEDLKTPSGETQDDLEKLFDEEAQVKAEDRSGNPSAVHSGAGTLPPARKEKFEDSTAKEERNELPAETGAQRINSKQIRLKVVVPETTVKEVAYLVDKTGAGDKDGVPFRLTSRQMQAIEKIVDSVSGVVDLTIKPFCPAETELAGKKPEADPI